MPALPSTPRPFHQPQSPLYAPTWEPAGGAKAAACHQVSPEGLVAGGNAGHHQGRLAWSEWVVGRAGQSGHVAGRGGKRGGGATPTSPARVNYILIAPGTAERTQTNPADRRSPPTCQQHGLRGASAAVVHAQVHLRQQQLMGHWLLQQEISGSSGAHALQARQACCDGCCWRRGAAPPRRRRRGMDDSAQRNLRRCLLGCLHHGPNQAVHLRGGGGRVGRWTARQEPGGEEGSMRG